jgi:hypothetical protein
LDYRSIFPWRAAPAPAPASASTELTKTILSPKRYWVYTWREEAPRPVAVRHCQGTSFSFHIWPKIFSKARITKVSFQTCSRAPNQDKAIFFPGFWHATRNCYTRFSCQRGDTSFHTNLAAPIPSITRETRMFLFFKWRAFPFILGGPNKRWIFVQKRMECRRYYFLCRLGLLSTSKAHVHIFL